MEAHDELMRRVMAAVNDADFDQLRKDLTADIVHHAGDGAVSGQDAVIGWYQTLCEQAGWTITPHAVISTDDWGSAIHRNTFHSGSYEVVTSGRIRDGQVAELWTVGMPDLTFEQISART